MELFGKIAAAALLGTAVAGLIRRSGGVMSLPLAAAVCAFALYAAASALEPVLALLQQAKTLSGLSEVYVLPVTKCVVIGILSRVTADLCRDGGQNAMAGAVELGATAAALYVSLPLLQTLLGLLERFL